eukprot:6457892-Amphidinium_carterae.1
MENLRVHFNVPWIESALKRPCRWNLGLLLHRHSLPATFDHVADEFVSLVAVVKRFKALLVQVVSSFPEKKASTK